MGTLWKGFQPVGFPVTLVDMRVMSTESPSSASESVSASPGGGFAILLVLSPLPSYGQLGTGSGMGFLVTS